MHMLTWKYLSSAELDTVRVSRRPITANGSPEKNEEATVHVYDLDLFLTVQRLKDTPPVLPLGQLCEDRGFFSLEWTGGQKNTSNQTWQEDTMQQGEIRAHGRSRSIEWGFQFQVWHVSQLPLFITELVAKIFYAETSKKRNLTGTKLSTEKFVV